VQVKRLKYVHYRVDSSWAKSRMMLVCSSDTGGNQTQLLGKQPNLPALVHSFVIVTIAPKCFLGDRKKWGYNTVAPFCDEKAIKPKPTTRLLKYNTCC
jgi:hypothetical protein